jgi:S-(hydroxymethyl)glutathione dehydrogenase/alcohol dehydrogenase
MTLDHHPTATDSAAAARFEGRTARAAIFREVGKPIEIEEVEVAEPNAGEVLVRMAASGVCHSDYHVVIGEWRTVPTPVVLGHEGAGVVEAVGEDVDHVKVGDPVVLSWSPNCRECDYCISGRPHLCEVAEDTAYRSVMFDGTSRMRQAGERIYSYMTLGSFGEYAVVPETGVIPIRAEIPLDRAALVGCAIATGWGAAVNTVQIPPGASAAVIGCGGVGLSAIQGAATSSAGPIIAVDVNDSKLELARKLGATHVVNAERDEPVRAVKELTGGRGADFTFEAIGRAATIEQAAAMLGPAGTAVLIGQVPDGVTITLDPLVLSDREHRIVGSNYGSCAPAIDFPRILQLYQQGVIDLDSMISQRIQLEDINDAFEAIGRGEAVRSVIVYDA